MLPASELRERAITSGWTWGTVPSSFWPDLTRWYREGHSIPGDETGEGFRHIYADSVPCVECGGWVEMNYRHSAQLRALGECFKCHYWLERVRQPDRMNVAIIDESRGRCYYTVGDRTGPSDCLGYGGQRFDIEFHDGRQVTTNDLWFGGEVPQRFLDRLPANARFLD